LETIPTSFFLLINYYNQLISFYQLKKQLLSFLASSDIVTLKASNLLSQDFVKNELFNVLNKQTSATYDMLMYIDHKIAE